MGLPQMVWSTWLLSTCSLPHHVSPYYSRNQLLQIPCNVLSVRVGGSRFFAVFNDFSMPCPREGSAAGRSSDSPTLTLSSDS
ncbi:hypothetical protein DFJ43DRAFT_1059159 [Lentinula guzmanii]|uniref:Secreted protein n=1 Tax=Lentinula guzmanii TaxID=2804957 RepID=A0AA38JHM3_9AGAR|nr:hypothetical protein DFJ43DRAFT_1059159 [Lentinula guzmanii]